MYLVCRFWCWLALVNNVVTQSAVSLIELSMIERLRLRSNLYPGLTLGKKTPCFSLACTFIQCCHLSVRFSLYWSDDHRFSWNHRYTQNVVSQIGESALGRLSINIPPFIDLYSRPVLLCVSLICHSFDRKQLSRSISLFTHQIIDNHETFLCS